MSALTNVPLKQQILYEFSTFYFRHSIFSLNFTDYVSMALCTGDNRVGDTSDLLALPQEMGLARRGSF